MTTTTDLTAFEVLLGTWSIELRHRALPGTVVPGSATFEWLFDGRFLVYRSTAEHSAFPAGYSLIGPHEDRPGIVMHYFDSRGVHRTYDVTLEGGVLRFSRDDPGFAQRFEGRISDDGRTIDGLWLLCEDGTTWQEDMRGTYRRDS